MKDSPGRKHFLLRLPHDLFERAKSYADKENFSTTQYINRAIEAYVEATDEVDEHLAGGPDPYPEDRIRNPEVTVKPRLVVVDLTVPRDDEADEGEKKSPPRPNPAWWA